MLNICAAVEWNNGKAYFFSGGEYVRFDSASGQADAGYPKSIASNWPGLWTSGIDAAVNWGNGKVYFFKGDQYIRYDVAKDCVDAGWPKPIKGNWNGLWTSNIDAIVNWGNGKVYCFKGDQYVRYDIATDRVEAGWPKLIAGEWAGVWDRDIEAIAKWDGQKAYFFKGGQCIRYDIAADRVDSGYPTAIPSNWLGSGGGSVASGEEAIRAQIVAVASGELTDRVHAKRFGGTDASGRKTRQGWEQLTNYFHLAAPGLWSDDTIKYGNAVGANGIPSWCGIFALWALKTGGASVGTWKMGSGIGSVQGIHQINRSRIKPGDVGFIQSPSQHHFIVAGINGDGTLDTIDGNSGTDSEVKRNRRPLSTISSFWSAF